MGSSLLVVVSTTSFNPLPPCCCCWPPPSCIITTPSPPTSFTCFFFFCCSWLMEGDFLFLFVVLADAVVLFVFFLCCWLFFSLFSSSSFFSSSFFSSSSFFRNRFFGPMNSSGSQSPPKYLLLAVLFLFPLPFSIFFKLEKTRNQKQHPETQNEQKVLFNLRMECHIGTTGFSRIVNSSTINLELFASNPEVGSSRRRIDGLVINSIPMEHLLLSPPLTPRRKGVPIFVSAHFESPNNPITSSTLSIFSSFDIEGGSLSIAE
mmetsp:Transcript_14003/g.19357  ORF Transcript_14003/g.19357 Transcript_14003/m.19357 type:complete len:262 (-) Transcript_14003:682-1467(-)